MVHLVTSAFPNLTELVLTNIVKITGNKHCYSFYIRWSTIVYSSNDTRYFYLNAGSTPQKTHLLKRLRRKGDVESDSYWNANKESSFQMLVENTPRLKSLTINADPGYEHSSNIIRIGVFVSSSIQSFNIFLTFRDLNDDEVWDLDALPLIAGWKNLRSLCLKSVPIIDGHFLVVIGKQCVNLEKLVLHSLGSRKSCCYVNELCQMHVDCKNLRELIISEWDIAEVSGGPLYRWLI